MILDCPSPDRTAKATFFWVHGGGAAGWAYFRVTVRGMNERLRPDRYQFQMRHGYDVRLIWKSPSALVVEYPDTANVDVQRADVRMWTAEYPTLGSDTPRSGRKSVLRVSEMEARVWVRERGARVEDLPGI